MNLPCRLLMLLLLPLGCTQAPTTGPGKGASAAPPPVAETIDWTDCTWSTPLVPGVPGSPGHLIPSSRNPNGQSELAVLMRSLQADLGAVRAALLHGAPPPVFLRSRHRKIRCSWPTHPADRNAQFDRDAQAYLAALEALDHHKSRHAFDQVLNACRACHEQSCSGAIVAIEALRLPAADLRD